ncbi:MAG: hypothetical protein C5B54_06510 [Acidobacteria bacterium]|nr:MAG: hypothetical protein C5B54_06510 [Acidobacteriota bacterium]
MTNFDKVIPPGSEGKVYASVDLSHAKGEIEKNVEITTNDPDMPSTRLFVKANVKTYVEVQPSDVVRFTLNKGESQTQEVVINNTYEKPLKLHDAVVDSDLFEVKMQPAGNEGKQYRLSVTAKNNLKIGVQKANIKIAVDGAPIESFPVQVLAIVRGPIAVLPQTVAFAIHTYPDQVETQSAIDLRQQANPTSTIVQKIDSGTPLQVIAQNTDWYQVIAPGVDQKKAPGQTKEEKIGWVSKSAVKVTRDTGDLPPQTVTLQKKQGTFKILNIVAGTSKIKAEQIQNSGDGKSYTLKIMVTDTKGLPQNGSIGSILVRTDDPDQPDINIPVFVLVT